MARETLPTALKLIFGDEGGYSNVKTDAGGPTKYGITHRTLAAARGVASVTAEQVKALTLQEAEAIYRKGYWTQSGGDLLPPGLDYAVFNGGVMSGPSRSVKVLQRVLGLTEDGSVGPQTVAAVRAYPGGVAKLIRDYCDGYMAFLRGIKGSQGFSANGRGWTIRITGKDPKGQYAPKPGVVGNAVKLALGAPPAVDEAVDAPMPTSVPETAGTASAIPPAPNPWTRPETIAQGVTALGGLGWLFTGSGPVQWALGAGLLIAAGVAAYYIIHRIRRPAI